MSRDVVVSPDFGSVETATPVELGPAFDLVFERTYLSSLEAFPPLDKPPRKARQLAWRRATRLPVHPTRGADDELPIRWQRMLTTLHGWNRRVAVVLMRSGRETALYFGTSSIRGDVDNLGAIAQLERAASGEIPGLALQPLSNDLDQEKAAYRQLIEPLFEFESCGAITGLPAARGGRSAPGSGAAIDRDLFSGLGQIAHGLKGLDNHDCSYAVMVLADAVPDLEICDVIARLRHIGERVHTTMKRTVAEGEVTGSSVPEDLKTSNKVMMLLSMLASAAVPYAGGATYLATQMLNRRGATTSNASKTISEEEIDMLSIHCKAVVDRHIDRLNSGRSFGFWNAGIYVLGDGDDTVRTVCGMLRASYSGQGSHIEPIRSILFPRSFGANQYLCGFRHVPLHMKGSGIADQEWHPLGPLYQYVSTPLNTEELAITTALPRKDVPGLRMQKNQVQFAMNGPLIESGRPVVLGALLGPGGVDVGSYQFDVNGLVRHGLLVGTTGSGKSTTCRRLIREAARTGVPFLIIEPAKDDYARWVVEHNRNVSAEERVDLYMPGCPVFDGQQTEELHLNPFEPARPEGSTPDPLARAEGVADIINSSMPMQEVLPLLMGQAIVELATEAFGMNFGEWPADNVFPRLARLEQVIRNLLTRGDALYEERIRANLFAAMKNRIGSLIRGRRGEVLNVGRSTPASRLFERSAVINLSRFGSEDDKALVMALLLLGAYEWRRGRYSADPEYRAKARNGSLAHLMVIEEAHTVLRRPSSSGGDEANPQAKVARMFADMLAEVRQYGQGLLVVDQDPTQLITATIKNTSFRIVHKLPHQHDRETLAASMLLRPDQCDFLALLPAGQAIISTENDDAPCWVRIEGDVKPAEPAE